MAVRYRPNGIGEALGDVLVTGAPLIHNGQVWFVHATDGNDSYDGNERGQPKASIAAAIEAAAAGDLIVLLDGHTETLTGTVTIGKRLTIVGAGRSSSRPTVKFTMNASSDGLFDVTAAGVEIRNVWIEENAQANDEARVNVTATLFRMIDCYIECGATDDAAAVSIGVSGGIADILGCTFVSTATAADGVPAVGLTVTAALARLNLEGSVFDGGTYGFDAGYALNITATVTQILAEETSFLRGADVLCTVASLGWYLPTTMTGDAYIDWTVS